MAEQSTDNEETQDLTQYDEVILEVFLRWTPRFGQVAKTESRS